MILTKITRREKRENNCKNNNNNNNVLVKSFLLCLTNDEDEHNERQLPEVETEPLPALGGHQQHHCHGDGGGDGKPVVPHRPLTILCVCVCVCVCV